jgi:exoribonuclease R
VIWRLRFLCVSLSRTPLKIEHPTRESVCTPMRLTTSDYKTFEVEGDPPIVFSDFRQANHCLSGDSVEWKNGMCSLVKRTSHRFIPGVLELTSKVLYGHTSRGAKIYLFHPLSRSYPPFRVGSSLRDTSKNQLGLVEFMEWEDVETLPRGSLIRLVGPCGDLTAERKALTYQYSSPSLSSQLFDIAEDTCLNRVPLPGLTFSIDPDGCMDIDDVLTLHQRSETEWEFSITISDVAAYILEGSDGDIHAYSLGQTLYQDGEAVVPMLPGALSEMALSLRPGEPHTGISLVCTWSTETKTLTVGDFKETSFTSALKTSYESIYDVKEIPTGILQDIASFLHGSPTTDSHEWVAECMLLYNKEVAKKLVENGVGLLRTHKPANAEALNQLTTIHPDLKALAYEAARYQPSGPDLIHAGLGSVAYCHASSPIRRYADLVNQRALKKILRGDPGSPVPDETAKQLNTIQKRMRAYERSLFFLDQVVQIPSGSVEGLVVTSTETKTKVYVPKWKQIIRVDPGSYTTGQNLTIDYYADLQKPQWDQRMVFRVSSDDTESGEHDE